MMPDEQKIVETGLGTAIEGSVANGINSLLGCGGGMFIMLLVTVVSVFFSFYLLKSLLHIVKDGMQTMNALREAIDDIIDKID